jgi:glutathione S-transferase
MALTLYAMSGSPFTWKVWLALEHKQLPYELRLLSVDAGDLKTPEFARLNPRRRAPVLTDGELSIYESEAIVRHLDATYPEPPLFPGGTATRARAFRLVAEVEAYFVPHMETLVQQVLFRARIDERDQARIAGSVEHLRQELSSFERELSEDFLAGPLSGADFALYPALMLALRLDKREPSLGLSSLVGPRLGAWMTRIEALPYYQRTYPPHWRAK